MTSSIQFYSTNKKAPKAGFREVLLTGQAPDKGLYMPETIPVLGRDVIQSFRGKPYAEVAYEAMRPFLADDLPPQTFKAICEDAYDYAVPLERVKGRSHLLWLDEGPTLAFKDFAARMMARLMSHYITEDEDDRDLTILTATSGDTGGAVAAAFHDLPGINVVVLFPEKEVSERQRKQMTTLAGNVSAVAVDGKFDDCQALVKEAFADPDLADMRLSSANSINFGRLLPQSVYYLYAYANLYEHPKDDIVYSVPSGNFGDLMGGLLAKKMGLPVSKFVVATNENDEFTRFMTTGDYEKIVPSKNCLSSAMNVGHPSNLARLFALYGGWLDETGCVRESPDLEAIRADLFAVSVTDEQTRATISEVFDTTGIILEPHGAVGWAGLMAYYGAIGEEPLACVLETADPAKFPETLLELGIDPPLPDQLKRILAKDEDYASLSDGYADFKAYLKNRFGA